MPQKLLVSRETLNYWLLIGDIKEDDVIDGMRVYPDYYAYCEWYEQEFHNYDEIDWLAIFPEKRNMKMVSDQFQQQAQELLARRRKLKDQLGTGEINADCHTAFERSLEKEAEALSRKISRLRRMEKTGSDGSPFDIAAAKKFPIPQLLEFNRMRKAKCPWHNDKHPSLQYFPKTNTVYCFSCSHSGDAIDVAQALWNVDFKEAVTKLTN